PFFLFRTYTPPSLLYPLSLHDALPISLLLRTVRDLEPLAGWSLAIDPAEPHVDRGDPARARDPRGGTCQLCPRRLPRRVDARWAHTSGGPNLPRRSPSTAGSLDGHGGAAGARRCGDRGEPAQPQRLVPARGEPHRARRAARHRRLRVLRDGRDGTARTAPPDRGSAPAGVRIPALDPPRCTRRRGGRSGDAPLRTGTV